MSSFISSRMGFAPVGALTIAAAAIAAIAIAPSAARAQQGNYTIGGDARAFGMGGAGIAVGEERSGNRINPASLAYENKVFGYHFPSFGFRSDNIDSNSATSFITGGSKTTDANALAERFAVNSSKNDADVGVNANASLRIGKFEVSGLAVGKADLLSNDAFKAWAGSGQTTQALLTNPYYNQSRVDLIGAGYYALPAVALATTLPAKPTTFYNYGIGTKLKYMKGFYTHYIADGNVLSGYEDPTGNAYNAALAPEMNGNNYLEKTGFGADVGFLAKPRHDRGFAYAALAANLIKPNFKFQGTDKNDNPYTYNIIKTTYSLGTAWLGKSQTVALDYVDMTAATGPKQLRFGVEQRLFSNKVAMRGGYNSTSGFTYGGGLLGFDFAFGTKVPLEIVKTLNF